MDTRERIFALLDKTDMEQQEFARRVGVSDDTASNWRRGRSASYNKMLPQIAMVLDTTVEYLSTGVLSNVSTAVTKADLQAAFWGGEKDLSQEDLDAMWDDVERFAGFLAEKKRQEKKND